MITTIQYVQDPNAVFEFAVTLDQQIYTARLTWNVFGRRLYLNIVTTDNTLVVSRALVGSPDSLDIQTLAWINGYVVATLDLPHGYPVLSTVPLTVKGVIPVDYNGQVLALIKDKFTLSWPLATNLGDVSRNGKVSFDLNLVEGYFQTSTLVYRSSSQTFEITP